MKKILSISLVTIYCLLSIGVAKSTHYCMGKAKDVSYFSLTTDGCFGVSEKRSMPCCSDEVEVFKIDEDQSKTSNQFTIEQLAAIVPIWLPTEFANLVPLEKEGDVVISYEDPPPIGEPIYQLLCNYTYYG